MEKDLKRIKTLIEEFIKEYDSKVEVVYDNKNRVVVSSRIKV